MLWKRDARKKTKVLLTGTGSLDDGEKEQRMFPVNIKVGLWWLMDRTLPWASNSGT